MSAKTDKTAKTDTSQSPENSTATNLAAAVSLLNEVSRLLAANIENTKEGSASDIIVGRLADRKADDVILACDVRVVCRNGEIARAYGENTLPSALAPHMLSHAHEGFDKLLQTTIVTPLVVSFQEHLASLALDNQSSREAIGIKTNLIDGEDPLLNAE